MYVWLNSDQYYRAKNELNVAQTIIVMLLLNHLI